LDDQLDLTFAQQKGGSSLPAGVGIRLDLDTRINYAMQQNDIPVIHAAHINNGSEEPLRDLKLRIISEPAFADLWEQGVSLVERRSTYNISPVELSLSPGYLCELTEGVRGQLRCEVWQGEGKIAEQVEKITLQTRNEWGGLDSLPEMIAAFVMPNHPTVAEILRDAADLLNQWTGDSSLSGYQSGDPKRVYRMVAAVYEAIKMKGISYINPPASFEAEGQRIRLPDQIIRERMATCLDLAVLTASCLEQIGLNAIVIFVRGHSFVGAWLSGQSFDEPAFEEPSRIPKRVDLDEILVFDPTCVTTQPRMNFQNAVEEAKRRFNNPGDFLCAVDIKRARSRGICPLPERESGPDAALGDSSKGISQTVDEVAPEEPTVPDLHTSSPGIEPDAAVQETPDARVERWKRKLLDLSFRNRLLNFKESKKTVRLLCQDISSLEDALAGRDASFRVQPLPSDLLEESTGNAGVIRNRAGDDSLNAVLREGLENNLLYSKLEQEELDRRMLEIFRAAKLGMEEGGANSLYLALGFLKWFEQGRPSQKRLSPILLLPLELARGSTREGISLRLGADEPRLNFALIEGLRQYHSISIAGLDPLPEDDSGLDVLKIMQIFKREIRDFDGWEVLESTQIGIFSFSKYLMWKDLADRENELKKNKVVKHLIDRTTPEPGDDSGFPAPETLDGDYHPRDVFCPLPADASQLSAVFAAAQGKSFVLEGPPGTGKSQTIANLISHCLAEKKSVLFVSEKMAALNVVHDRLKKLGLDSHCLELHSNKAKKRDVLVQLDSALSESSSLPPREWERETSDLGKIRDDLNAYANALHQPRNTGDSIFKATSQLAGLRKFPRLNLRWPSFDVLDETLLDAMRGVVSDLADAAQSVGNVSEHPWRAVRRKEWEPRWQQKVRESCEYLESLIDPLENSAREACSRIAFEESDWSFDKLRQVDRIAQMLIESPELSADSVLRANSNSVQQNFNSWIEHGRNRDQLRSSVLEYLDENTLNSTHLRALHNRLVAADNSWGPVATVTRFVERRQMKPYSKPGMRIPLEELRGLVEQALELDGEKRFLAQFDTEARELLGRYWNDGEADWVQIESILEWLQNFHSLAAEAAGDDFQRAEDLRASWARLASEGNESLKPEGAIGRNLHAFRDAFAAYQKAVKNTEEILDLDRDCAWGPAGDAGGLSRMRETLRGWSDNKGALSEWCAWRRSRDEGMNLNLEIELEPMIASLERGDIQVADLMRVFNHSYYHWWHDEIISEDPILRTFSGPQHALKIKKFQRADDHYIKLTKQIIKSRLSSRIPRVSGSDIPGSEREILMKQIGLKKPNMSIRKLIGKIPNLLRRLKPCLLMSPMSVAQYLDASYPPFDLVVFDEASQIPVWDAVGAIARGKEVVIVGDDKQLPPTNFFQRSDEDEDEDELMDLENILRECTMMGLSCHTLRWHYRSRREGLIAFSNFHYYNNGLFTFPSPFVSEPGVSIKFVNGVYDRGKSATNRIEADAVVAEVVRRVSSGERSIGVVTFSRGQQVLIEDLLDKARKENQSLDSILSEDQKDSVFVKNIENVQGDERDVIIFSICYGPDRHGRVRVNFGPMNKEGGQRRLNVAITRARREVLVFSSMRGDQINLSKTRSRGVRDLKNFLDYAERGPSAIAEATQYNPDADFDSPFEREVCEALRNKGWEVHNQVGCASYRIDLAVVDPEAEGRYLLGIECDGANYHRAKTARDRDKLREGVLRDLGWQIHRIWSTDWWNDPERELRKIESALEKAKQVREDASLAPSVPDEEEKKGESRPEIEESVAAENPPAPVYEPYLPVYEPYLLGPGGSPEDFYQNGSSIREAVSFIIMREAPVAFEVVVKRVANLWGMRASRRVRERVRELLPRGLVMETEPEGEIFLWMPAVRPEAYTGFRIPGSAPESRRKAQEIPLREIANAALFLMRQHIAAPERELARETGRLFGFRRVSGGTEDRMRAGIEHLVGRGEVRREEDQIILVEPEH